MSNQSETMRPAEQERTALPLILILAVVAIFFRINPGTYWWNFTPVGALALFAGARLRWWLALLIPILVMATSDLVLWATKNWTPFNPWVYGSFLTVVLLGFLLRRTESVWKIGGTCLLGSVVFFLVTNFSAWVATSVPVEQAPPGKSIFYDTRTTPKYTLTRYTRDFKGLMTCYAMALPFTNRDAPPFGFFGNQLLGDFFFCGIIFGMQALLWRRVGRKAEAFNRER